MSSELPQWTTLRVTKSDQGDVEIVVVESAADGQEKRSLVIRSEQVPALIEMLRRQVEDGDPEERSTMRKLQPVS